MIFMIFQPKNAQEIIAKPSEESPQQTKLLTQPQTTDMAKEKLIGTSPEDVPPPRKKSTRERMINILRRSNNRKPEDEELKVKTKPRANSWISGFFRSHENPKLESELAHADETSRLPLRSRRHSQDVNTLRSQAPPSNSKNHDRFSFPGKDSRDAKRRYSHVLPGNTHHEVSSSGKFKSRLFAFVIFIISCLRRL